MLQQQRYRVLLDGHKANRLTETEEVELFALLNKPEYQILLEQDILEQLRLVQESGPFLSDAATKRISQEIINTKPEQTPWKKWAVAAAVLLMGTAAWLLLQNQANPYKSPAVATNTTKHDVAPGGNKATLTLADGANVVLDSLANGIITQQGNTIILKPANGRLTYSAKVNAGRPASIVYNTLSVPRKGKFQLRLEDGSDVWMNAASTLRFPASFNGVNRTVELEGEAYFEIAANRKQPFHVKINGINLEVLGTSFNVMAYKNEDHISATILSGAVRVSRGDSETLLSPGQQLQLKEGNVQILKNVDTEQAIAWKENNFYFKNASISVIMRAIARWYDVEIVYQDDCKERFFARLSRDLPLSHVLKALELTGKVHFQINENKITVQALK